jgi:hypothetical protein
MSPFLVKQVNCWILVFFSLLGAAGVSAAPDPKGATPPLDFVQGRLWRNMYLQDFELEGIIRTEKKIHPIVLKTKGREMIYEFKETPLQLRVFLSPEFSIIQKRSQPREAWKMVEGKEKTARILDSDITYEDLALDFIRWKKVKALGTDNIKTLAAWAFEAEPSDISRYAKARYWISSEFFAFLRVDAYNDKNQVIKRVEVNGVQQIGNAYVIKEMQISSLVPGRELSQSRTYVEIRSGKPRSGP